MEDHLAMAGIAASSGGWRNLPLLRLAALVFGVVFLTVGALGVRAGLQSARWPTAPATVVISEQVGFSRYNRGRVVARWRTGQDLRDCGIVHFGYDTNLADVRAHPVGSATRVAWDPADPSRCVIEPGVGRGVIVFALVGAAFLGVAWWAHARLGAASSAAA